MQLSLNKIPDIARRQAISAVLETREAINNERIAAAQPLFQRIQKRRQEFDQEVADARALISAAAERMKADVEALENELAGLEESYVVRMEEIYDELIDQYSDVRINAHGEVVVCAVTGLPVLDGDEVWRNPDYGIALMCVFAPLAYAQIVAETATQEAAE